MPVSGCAAFENAIDALELDAVLTVSAVGSYVLVLDLKINLRMYFYAAISYNGNKCLCNQQPITFNEQIFFSNTINMFGF